MGRLLDFLITLILLLELYLPITLVRTYMETATFLCHSYIQLTLFLILVMTYETRLKMLLYQATFLCGCYNVKFFLTPSLSCPFIEWSQIIKVGLVFRFPTFLLTKILMERNLFVKNSKFYCKFGFNNNSSYIHTLFLKKN